MNIKTVLTMAALTAFLAGCASAPPFTDVSNRNWKLAEVRDGKAVIAIDRDKLAKEGLDIFTLRFDADQVNGIGAPNHYFSPYVLEDKQGIAISALAGTLMAPVRELHELKEQAFFSYVRNAYKWNLSGRNLELYSKGDDGADVILVFVPGEK